MKRFCALVLILSAVTLFVFACGGNDGPTRPPDYIPGYLGPLAEYGEKQPPERLFANVPDRDFEGHEFVILANSAEWNPHWYSRDICAEELTGEAINDAVYHRNRAVEERFNIIIRGEFSANQSNDARTSIMAGDNAYDMFTIALQTHTAPLAQEGLLLDLRNVPYVDLVKPWWDQRANEQLSIGNRLFFTISDLLIIDKDALFIFLFNKDVQREHGLDDPYQLVRDGRWTVDTMWDMARSVSADLNGDGIMDRNDRFGLLMAGHTIHGNVVGSGHFIITKDSSDMPILNISHPMMLESFDKWIEIMSDTLNTGVTQDLHNSADIWLDELVMFSEGRGLFLYTGMNRVTLARAMDFNFGILPNPKLNEAQTDFYNHVHAWCTTAIAIPITSDLERTGIILEALTAESFYTLRPAYYDISLVNQLLRDEESEEMLDLIFATRAFDLGHVFNWGGAFDMFFDLGLNKNPNFVSAYERILARIERDMQATIDLFMDLE